jgi:hypothetical protein
VIELSNNGTKPIYSKDFESPIEVSFGKEVKVVLSRVETKSPENLNVTLEVQNQAVRIQPLLLNANDKFVFSVVTSGLLPNPIFNARIAGISKIDVKQVEDDGHGWKVSLFFSIIALASFTLANPFLEFIIRKTQIKINRIFAACAYFVFISVGYVTVSLIARNLGFESGSLKTMGIFTAFFIVGAIIDIVWNYRNGNS